MAMDVDDAQAKRTLSHWSVEEKEAFLACFKVREATPDTRHCALHHGIRCSEFVMIEAASHFAVPVMLGVLVILMRKSCRRVVVMCSTIAVIVRAQPRHAMLDGNQAAGPILLSCLKGVLPS